MKVLAHPDPVVLERELLARLDDAHPDGGIGRTLVVVPNSRLARHVQRRASELRRGWLGLEVLNFRELAYRILDHARARPPRVVSSRLLNEMLQRVLREPSRANLWTRFVQDRPGALVRIRAGLNDLREAWIAPGEVAACCDAESERALGEIYRGYWEALEAGSGKGWGDEAALARAALAHAEPYGAGCGAIFLHGAYELIGVHLDLMRALDRTGGVTALVPVSADAPVTAYAERFMHDFLLGDTGSTEALDGAGAEDRPDLAALYDEPCLPSRPSRTRFAFRHATGEAAEVKVAVHAALEAIREGLPPEEVVLAARTLEPYAAALEEAFLDADVPWTSSLEAPLRRYPVVRDFLLLLDAVAGDFPRRATAELLRSPRIYWKAIVPDAAPFQLDRADLWSRQARILGGLREWTIDLPRWAREVAHRPDRSEEQRAEARERAERRGTAADSIAAVLVELKERIAPTARGWNEHSGRLGRLLRTLFFRPGGEKASAAVESLEQLLDEMACVETVIGERGRIPFDEMRRWLEEAVQGTSLPLQSGDTGGIRVLDLMQLRGITCGRLHLLGLNSGMFPRPVRDDPILTDRSRRRLRERTRRPLPVKELAGSEERLLLALTLGAPKDSVDVSWQRADEAGRAKTPSLALRELARLAVGRPDVTALRPDHVPSHPTHALEHLLERPGLLSPEDEILLTALRSRGPRSVEALATRFPQLASGVAMLSATQPFQTKDAAYDGRVGPTVAPPEVSVSALESLGRCPLRFFFRHVLRVKELEEPAGAFDIAPREMGLYVHELLERLYRTLLEGGEFKTGSAEPLRRRARELLAAERSRILGALGERLTRRLPVLGGHLAGTWYETIGSFLDADLEWLIEHGRTVEELEQPRAGSLELGEDATITVRGRFDRTLTGAGAVLVGDYKTSGNLRDRVNPTSMLKARRLQVPLYSLLAGGDSEVELLGVGPDFDVEVGYRFRFPGFAEEQLRGFRETMRVLLELRERGSFPFHKSDDCRWCPYGPACRRNHPPTIDREEQCADSEPFRLLGDKTRTKPLLSHSRRPS